MNFEIETVGIDELKPAPKNARRHPVKQVEALKESYRLFGQYRPLVVDSDGTVIVGNGMLKALQELGVGEVEVKRLPVDFPEPMKKKLMLADNKTQQIGSDDVANIEELILDIGDFEIPGFDSDILEELYGDGDPMEAYGILPSETVQTLSDRQKKAESADNAEVVHAEAERARQASPTFAAFENDEATSAERHSGNFITCPNCGMKIWQ